MDKQNNQINIIKELKLNNKIKTQVVEIMTRQNKDLRIRLHEARKEPSRTLVLVLGVISCLTIIGTLWGVPMIFTALNIEWD